MRALARARSPGCASRPTCSTFPGGHGKSPIGPGYLERAAEGAGGYVIEDFNGGRHAYAPPAATPCGPNDLQDA